jgi:hypothetical protein
MAETQWDNVRINDLGINEGPAGGFKVEVENVETGVKNEVITPFTGSDIISAAQGKGDFEIRNYVFQLVTPTKNDVDSGIMEEVVFPHLRAIPANMKGIGFDLSTILSMVPNPLTMAARAAAPTPYGGGTSGEEWNVFKQDWEAGKSFREWAGERGVEATRKNWEEVANRWDKYLKDKGMFSPFEYIGTDMTPNEVSTLDKMVGIALEFGLSGAAEVKGAVMIPKLTQDFLRFAKRHIKGGGAATREETKNIFDRAAEHYSLRTRAGRRNVYGEVGVGAAFGESYLFTKSQLEDTLGPVGGEIAGVVGGILTPSILRRGFSTVAQFPGVRTVKKYGWDPFFRHDIEATKAMRTGLGWTGVGGRRKLMRVHDILAEAWAKGGEALELVAGISMTTPELAYSQSKRLRMLSEDLTETRDRLQADVDAGRPTYHREGEKFGVDPELPRDPEAKIEDWADKTPYEQQLLTQQERLDEIERLTRQIDETNVDAFDLEHYGNFQYEVYEGAKRHAQTNPAELPEFFRKQWEATKERRINFLDAFYRLVDDDLGGINLGGIEGGTPAAVRADWHNYENQDISLLDKGKYPKFEANRRKLLLESNLRGLGDVEESFINELVPLNQQDKLKLALDNRRADMEGILDATREAANTRIQKWQESLGLYLENIGKTLEDLPPEQQMYAGQVVQDIYADTARQWDALEKLVWADERIPGLMDTMADVRFPENTIVQIHHKDVNIGGLTAQQYAQSFFENMPGELKGGRSTPTEIASLVGQESILKTIRETDAARQAGLGARAPSATETTRINRLESDKAKAETNVQTTRATLDRQIVDDRKEWVRHDQEIGTHLKDFESQYGDRVGRAPSRDGPAISGLLRFVADNPKIQWPITSPEAFKTILNDVPDQVSQSFGIPLTIPIKRLEHPPLQSGADHIDINVAASGMDREVVQGFTDLFGYRAADNIFQGKMSLDQLLRPALREAEAGKRFGKPFDVIYKNKNEQYKKYGETALDEQGNFKVDAEGVVELSDSTKADAARRKVIQAETDYTTANRKLDEVVAEYMGNPKDPETGDPITLPNREGVLALSKEGLLSGLKNPQDVQSILSILKRKAGREKAKEGLADQELLANYGSVIKALESLLTPAVFPNLDEGFLASARDISRTIADIETARGPVIAKGPTRAPKVAVEEVTEQILGQYAGKPAAQAAAMRRIKMAVARVPDRMFDPKGGEVIPGSGGRTTGKLNEEIFYPIDREGVPVYQRIFDNPDYPMTVRKVGGKDWEVVLKNPEQFKAPTPGNEQALDIMENILAEQLANTFPTSRETMVTASSLSDFRNSWKTVIDALETGGRGGNGSLIRNLDEIEDATTTAETINAVLKDSITRKVDDLWNTGQIPTDIPGGKETIVQNILGGRVRNNYEQHLADTLGKGARPDPGFVVKGFIETIQKPGLSNPSTTIDNFLSAFKGPQNAAALKGLKVSLITNLFEMSTTIGKGPGPGNLQFATFNPEKMKRLLQDPNIAEFLGKTFSDVAVGKSGQPAIVDGLHKMVDSAIDISPYNLSDIPVGKEPWDAKHWVRDEMFSNLGRVAGLQTAKATGLVNELFAAGTGGRIFRRIGERFTGNNVMDMVIQAAIDPELAIGFLKDIRADDFSWDKWVRAAGKAALDTINLPDMAVKAMRDHPGAVMEIITEPLETLDVTTPDPGGPLSPLKPQTSLPGAPTLASRMPQSRPLVAGSTLDRAAPLQFAAAAPPPQQLAATGAPRPETMAGLAEVGLPLFPAFANKGGLASIRKKKKSRQMVY